MATAELVNQIRSHVLLLAVFVLLQATAAHAQAEYTAPYTQQSNQGNRIKNRYIVELQDTTDVETYVNNFNRGRSQQNRDETKKMKKVMKGFSGPLTQGEVNQLRRDRNVKGVEEDGIYRVNDHIFSWGLDRVDQRDLPLDGNRPAQNIGYGDGVHIYIIDTGTELSHEQFNGFVDQENSYDVFGATPGLDEHGHGTHCGGTAAGHTTGVAPGAIIHSIRVLDSSGSGSTSGIVVAMEWLINNKKDPAVASMSLGGGYSSALNNAVDKLVNAGVVVVVAAGNEDYNACWYSPASAAKAISVGATTSNDERAYYSNYGACVDIFAPGSSIYSSYKNGGYAYMSGTSMACPHVSGAAAVILGEYPWFTPAEVTAKLQELATKDKVSLEGNGSPRSLLFLGDEGLACSSPCQNGGTCNDDGTCTCVPGYTGSNCGTNIDDCTPSPCQNGGSCYDGVNGYSCGCAAGYTGTNCETSTPCSPSPCQNGGSCNDDGVGGYTCSCAPGFTGGTCLTNIDDCTPSPCQNGGTCYDGVNGYSCGCADGYTGTNCETPYTNPCSPNPCQNGGSCNDNGVGGYTCSCAPGFTGGNCETAVSIQCIPGSGGETYNGYCYYYQSSLRKTWDDAEAYCNNLVPTGANLVSILSEDEYQLVDRLREGRQVWIGLNDKDTETTFVWSDGTSPLGPVSKWIGGSSESRNSGGEDCVTQQSRGSGKWRIRSCSQNKRFICKYQLSSS